MKTKTLLSIALGMLAIPTILQPRETYGFMMGGGHGTCDIFIEATQNGEPNGPKISSNYYVTLETKEGGKETVPFMVMFNKNCAKVQQMPHAVYHINNGTNLFFLKEYGDMVVYSTTFQGYDKLQRTRNAGALYNNYVKNDDGLINRFNTLFVNYSVPKNDTSCGYKASNNNPICILNQTYYNWGHSLSDYSPETIEKYTTALKEGDRATIDALTGEYEHVGYSTDGTPMNNAYFPSEYPVRYQNGKVVKSGSGGSGKANAYPWIDNPWNWGTPKTQYDDGWDSEFTSIKRKAIARLIDQENLGFPVDKWMNKLSLKNNPTAQAGVFEGRENGKAWWDEDSNSWKQLYNLVILEAADGTTSPLKNVAIMEMSLYDGKEWIASYKRQAIGYEQADVSVKEVNGKPVVLEGGKEYTLKIKVVNGSSTAISTSHKITGLAKANDENLNKEDREAELNTTKGGTTMSSNGGEDFTIKFKMPEANGTVNIALGLDENTYATVNSNRVDDRATINVQVKTPKGDISVCGIELFEKGGTKAITQADIVQDREYDVEYYICYSGDNVPGKHKINITGTLSTSGKYHQEISLDRTIEVPLDKTIAIRETIRVSNPEIITNIKISTDNKNINTNLKNDEMDKIYSNAPNIKLTNLKITPGKIEFTPIGCHVITVSYDLTLQDVKSNYNATFDTKTRIVIGNQEFEVVDKIKKGTNKYTHNLTYCFPSGDDGGTRKVIAEANKNQTMFESTIADNKGEIDWIGNSGALNRNGCPVGDNVKNEVTWTQQYTIDTVEVWMEKDSKGNLRLLQKVIKSEPKIVENQTESFKITSIQMRSKLQQDLKLGDNGWIDVIRVTDNGATQVAKPKIKAGYGFEFRIQAEYATNVFADVKQELDLDKLNRGEKQTIQVVSAGAHESPNLVTDFYLTVGGKTLNNGNGLTVTPDANNPNLLNITITPHTSPNTNEAGDTRLYVNESTADGTYNMKFYTPAITGLTSRTDKENTILCDEIEIEFDVVGSVYDDLNSHQTN